MRRGARSIAGIVLLLAVSSVSAQQAAPKWGPHVDVEAKPGTKRSIGEADFFLPLMQDGRTLFFGNARLRIADHDNKEGNFGLGVRRMLEGGWNIGGYGYFDRRRTSTGNKFNQATFGVEALGRDWDFRGNAYLPQGDRVRELSTTTVGGGTPTASIVGTTVQVTTPGSTTFTAEERALKGYDLEAGWRLPVWAAEADKQLRLYAGAYHFSDSGIRVSGPRVRAELAMYDLPALWQGAQLMLGAEYQDDNARGGQGFVSVRLRVPLGGGNETGRKMNFQERRMAAPVVRDVDVVTQERSVVTASTPTTVETATATAGGQAVTVLDSGTTTGAALPGAVAAAGPNSTVVLTGTYNTTTTTLLQNGQTLMGAGALQVRTPSGHVATLTTPGATINGNIPSAQFGKAFTVDMAPNSTLRGMTVTHFNTSGHGATAVRASGASNVQIVGNTISASSSGPPAPLAAEGILILAGSTNVLVSNNIISATGTTVQNLAGINASPGGFSTVTLSGNTVTVSGSGIANAGIGTAGGVPGGTIATIAGNTVSATGGGTNRAFSIVTTAVTAGSSGNVRAAGTCNFFAGTSGSIGFTDGTTCP